MSSLSKDNQKIEKCTYSSDDAWYFKKLNQVQRLISVGLVAQAEGGFIETPEGVADVMYFLEEIESAILDGRLNGTLGANPYWERRTKPQE